MNPITPPPTPLDAPPAAANATTSARSAGCACSSPETASTQNALPGTAAPVALGMPLSSGEALRATSFRHGTRSAMTCRFRCSDACDDPLANPTQTEHVHSVITRAIGRRTLIGTGLTAAAVAVQVQGAAPAAAHADGAPAGRTGARGGPDRPRRRGAGTWEFEPVPPNTRDRITVPVGFTADLLIAWGDPVTRKAPRFDVARQSARAARQQFGYNNDYVGLVPHPTDRRKALMVVNHEYTDEPLMFPPGRHTATEEIAIAQANHGLSVVELRRGKKAGMWEVVPAKRARYNRRLHDRTVYELAGPAAGARDLRTADDPRGRFVHGTFGNCAGGRTPWGTILSGEENFNQYFDASGELPSQHAESWKRYGITGKGRGWSSVDDRFDLTRHPNEAHRFGWIVEIDPSDPDSTPRKHTMLGRFKHEGANCTIAPDGRVVVHSGDDERGEYVYRFVSRDRFDPRPGRRARRHNMGLLEHGTLSVARFRGESAGSEHDGVGEWIRLADDRRSYVRGMSRDDVLIHTRLAADTVSPTPMDRPEDVEVNPVNGRLYLALTNNSGRGTTLEPDAANPVSSSMVRATLDGPLVRATGNRNGYVMELTPRRGDHTRDTFDWNLVLVCGDPSAPETWFAGFPKQLVSPISCPDNLAFDAVGNLWISTDGNALGSHDGLFRMPLAGPERGHLVQFLTVPVGAETCGPFVADDQQSVLVAVQHPGETDDATFDSPTSTWPGTHRYPRPGVVAIRKL